MPLIFDDEEHEKILKDLRTREAEDLARLFAQKLKLGYADLSGISIESDALVLVPEIQARESGVATFEKSGNKVKIAIISLQNPHTQEVMKELTEKGFALEVYIASEKSLKKAWSRYSDIKETSVHEAGVIEVSEEKISTLDKKNETSDQIRSRLSAQFSESRPISDLIKIILESAIAEHASDIHLEPQEDTTQLRLRIDGILVPILNISHIIYKKIISRLKILSGLKLNITRDSQDGRFTIEIDDMSIEVRVSLIPGAFGESVVMRLLNPDSIQVSLDTLGMDEYLKKRLYKEISKPNGLILTTGPTGSGKTTTLYAFLKHIYEPGIKIITIEDPVEYRLPGIVQTQVDKDKDYDFYNKLTSSLRQDPDVIMVGEIRDANTAKTAVQASLTGHTVFSTLHTNDASSSIPRMRDLGVREDILGSSLNIILAQRLVRKLNENKKERPLTEKEKILFQQKLADVDPARWMSQFERGTIFEPQNQYDEHLDYSGRVGIFEGIVVDEQVEDMIRNQVSPHEIDRAGRLPYNILSLQQHGLISVLNGVTDIGELERIISLE